MSGDYTLQELLEAQEHFGLPDPALIEKDFYVSKALAAISRADIEPLRLIFGGGTALFRAYRLLQRMSEDVDLKIVGEPTPTRSQLRHLRERVTDKLLAADFEFDPKNPAHRYSRNESRYTMFQLPYASLLQGKGVLRPEIQIELTLSRLYRTPVYMPFRSFVAEAFDRPAEVLSVACVSITQTVAEKFVALTLRTAIEIADGSGKRDPTLVRHIYDLHVTRPHYNLKEVAQLAKSIMTQDAIMYGNQFPAYRDDPTAQTRLAIAALGDNPHYAKLYRTFERDMIYGDRIPYTICLATLTELADLLG